MSIRTHSSGLGTIPVTGATGGSAADNAFGSACSTVAVLVAGLLSVGLFSGGVHAQNLGSQEPGSQNLGDVPGYAGTSPPETGYGHGNMFDDAEARALTSQAMDGEAARTVTQSFQKRPFVPADPASDWFSRAEAGEQRPGDFFSVMSGAYEGCEGGTVTPGTQNPDYVYECSAPAYRNKHATLVRLTPVCEDKRTACWTVTSAPGIMPYSYDGKRWITLGRKGSNSIPDGYGRIHYYTATLTFEIEDVEEIARFRLNDLWYEDFIEVQLNGHTVFSDLDRAQYTRVSRCNGCHVINRRMSQYLNFDLMPWLQTGINTFFVRLTAYAHGELFLNIDTDAACCRQWRDQWTESGL